MRNEDNFRLKGNVVIKIFDLNGVLIKELKAHNLICNDLRTVWRRRLGETPSGGAGPLYPVERMWFGRNGSNLNVKNTNLMDPIGEGHKTPSVTYGINKVIFSVTLEYNEPNLNGEILEEAGLFTAVMSGDPDLPDRRAMYARVVFPPIEKTETIKVIFEWTLWA